MNQIETKMCKAVLNGADMSQDNTTVKITRAKNGEFHSALVRLHGNEIAHYFWSGHIKEWVIRLSDGDWQTRTTKSRLIALIERVVYGDEVDIFQKNKKWYYRMGATTYDWIGAATFMAEPPNKVRFSGQKRETT